jgi:hypothetical protein
MTRVLIALITTLPLALGVATAQASTQHFPGLSGGTGGTGGTWVQQAAVAGTVVSTDPTTGTVVANAYVLTPPTTTGTGGGWGSGTGTGTFGFGSGGFGGLGAFGSMVRSHTPTTPTTTQVTITTNSSTTIHVGGMMGDATVGDLAAGDKFLALFPGSSSDSITTLVASPATSIFAQVPMQFYAFVGTVASTDTTADTLTADVSRSLPSSLITVGSDATFTVGAHTFIIGGSSLSTSSGGGLGGLFGGLFGGTLGDVSQGDMVAGGLIGQAGMTAAQVEASPLMFLLDLPAPSSTTGTGTTTGAAKAALKETLKLLHGAKVKLVKSHRKSHGKSHGKSSKHHGRR